MRNIIAYLPCLYGYKLVLFCVLSSSLRSSTQQDLYPYNHNRYPIPSQQIAVLQRYVFTNKIYFKLFTPLEMPRCTAVILCVPALGRLSCATRLKNATANGGAKGGYCGAINDGDDGASATQTCNVNQPGDAAVRYIKHLSNIFVKFQLHVDGLSYVFFPLSFLFLALPCLCPLPLPPYIHHREPWSSRSMSWRGSWARRAA